MERTITRTYCFDGDICEVLFRYDDTCGKYFGDYPDFELMPRYTVNGWMWISAMQNGCTYGVNKYSEKQQCVDCGSCIFFKQEQTGDLIGICSNEKNKNK